MSVYTGHLLTESVRRGYLFSLFRYVQATDDRVTVVFSTVFRDDDDVIIGKVFMQVQFRLAL